MDVIIPAGIPFQLEPFQTWAKEINLEQQIALEPFAGAKDIPRLIDAAHLQCQDWALFDIDPGAKGVAQRDTLADFPRGFNVCITNPPWLARNSATRRGLPFPEATDHDDLYKYALEQCLTYCGWVAAIIPEAFIRSGLFLQRLSDFISLVPQTHSPLDKGGRGVPVIENTRHNPLDKGGRGVPVMPDKEDRRVPVMFEDTEHPVGLALFTPIHNIGR